MSSHGRSVYTPKDTFIANYEGVPTTFTAGVTFVREGHPLLDTFADLFEEVRVRYEVEEAVAAPGSRRAR